MVHRTSASTGKKGPSTAKRSRKSRDDEDDMSSKRRQWSNVPPELDEDIDDDLAFDSDDEAKYGAFFASSSKTKPKNATRGEAADELAGTFNRLNAVQRGGKPSGEDDAAMGFSDDSRDEIDLSEMLDSKEDMRAARAKRRTKAQQKIGRKSTVKEPLTTEAETLLGPSDSAGGSRQSKPGVKKLLQAAAAPAASRLESSLANNRMVLTRDVDDITKERKDRSKVREIVSEQLTKYKPILKQQTSVRHLAFPLRPVEAVCPVPKTLTALVAAVEDQSEDDKGKSSSSHTMASKMKALLQASGLQAKQAPDVDEEGKENIIKFSGQDDEQAQGARPSVGYMQKLKSMLSYENARRRRFNKIKSKTYRRILRKEKEREEERRDKAFELLHPEEARRRLQKKMDDMRAEERVTQKHKNTSKWVRHAKKFAKIDGNTKDAIDEQHQIHQRLMTKMEADATDEINGKAAETDESEEEERVVDALLAGDKKAKSALWADDDNAPVDVSDMTPVDRARAELRQMDFMKKAKLRHDDAMESQLRDLEDDIKEYAAGTLDAGRVAAGARKRHRRAEAGGGDDGDALDELADNSADEREGFTPALPKKKKSEKQRPSDVQGRRRFGEGRENKESRQVDLGKRRGPTAEADVARTQMGQVVLPESDPFCEIVNDEEEGKPTTAHRLKKSSRDLKHQEGFAGDRVTAIQKSKCTSTRVVILPKQKQDATATPINVADEGLEPAASMNQDYLVARAFANDEVDEEFLAMKERQVEDIMRPVDKNASLPGWGEWGGESERLNTNHKAKVDKMDLERRIEKSSLMKARADAELENVIINHEVDLVPDKYQLHLVPRPFSNAKEFARSLRQPMGPEWNTALSFKEGNQPRITTIQGVAIDPLSLDAHVKKSKTARRKMSKKSSIGGRKDQRQSQ